ncbi:MAG: DNA alkylation repair protein [Candidatus Gastranaerophilales bacterium]|nr:DNA alkylation repair protein [Candidatus Gastranaerophilales bacterium]
MIEDLKKELISLSDEKYQKFSSSLTPNIDDILGVRLPILRKIAKRITKEDYQIFFKENDDEYMEQTMLEGMVIGLLSYQEQKKYIEKFILKINNWAVCDSFCASLKTFKTKKEDLKKLIEKLYSSKEEYLSRTAYVLALNYLIDKDMDYVLEKIEQFNNEEYYAKMAAAWCFSICIIKHYDKVLEKINKLKIHPWVFKKGLTKAIESLKLTKEQKEKLRQIRK